MMPAEKPNRGEKRRCMGCNTLFFDMQRSPVLCPHCGAAPGTAPARPKLKSSPPRPPRSLIRKAPPTSVAGS